jgi:hypothetical protein
MNVHHDDNHELMYSFNVIVSAKQPWWFATPWYYLPRIGASTPIVTYVGFQNQPLITNINLVPTNLEVEQFQLFNRLEQLCPINQRPYNQSISIPNLELVEPWARPMIVCKKTTYQQGSWLVRFALSQGERSQVLHHRSVSRGNQGARTITYSYCQQVGHIQLLPNCWW